jgi:asparagine synthase (glutamine-hydrolysing)
VCGICGFVLERKPPYAPEDVLDRMCQTMLHRGPDSGGRYVASPVFLGHRRLEIIDLSTGAQPMKNEDGSIITVFNGEIYNFKQLRAELEQKGHRFSTNSDTEVVLHLWEEEGRGMPARLNGMFALAVWDARREELFLARDRMGKKPLYWAPAAGAFVFGSELKAVSQHPAVGRRARPSSVAKYLLFDCVPAPATILEGVFKLEPGTWLAYKRGSHTVGRYWDISFPARNERVPPFRDACEQSREILKRAVERRLISDVPLGVFLSGGIDSSIVTALMCRLVGPTNVKSFSVGFSTPSFDESAYSKMVATWLHTTHYSNVLHPETMMELLPGIIGRLDEPLADNSLIPTYFLSKFARERVTVALGGDGGDELCLGYPTFQAHRIARWYERLPALLRRALTAVVEALPVSTANISLDYQARQFVRGMQYDRFARHFVWIGSIPPAEQNPLLSPAFCRSDPGEVIEDVARHAAGCVPRDDFDLLTYLYCKLYMCDDILTKVDRAAMMNSLEVRAPFLDVEHVEFITALPTRYKMRLFRMKRLLKEAFKDELPEPIIKRKKKGFGIPIADWLKGELRPWVEELLSPSSINRHAFFEPGRVQSLWEEHLAGIRDNRKPLWSLVVLLLWAQENL